MGLIITTTANGGLKIKSEDGKILRVFPKEFQISIDGNGNGILISPLDPNYASFNIKLSEIVTVSGSAPASTVEGLIDQINTSLAAASGGSGGSGGSGVDREFVVSTYTAKNPFTGAAVGDTITAVQVIDVSSTPTTVATIWRNQTTGADLSSAPSAANLTLVGSTALTDIQLRAAPVITVPRSKVPVTTSGLSALNTDLLTGTVSGWFRVADMNSGSFQIITSAGITAGAITFEHTNDITNASAGSVMPVYERNQNAVPVLSAITVSASSAKIYVAPIDCEYIRVRITSAIVGGTIGIAAELSNAPLVNIAPQVTQPTPANLQSLGTVAPLAQVVDIPSGNISANTTTAVITPSSGLSDEIIIDVTAVSATGTLPVMLVNVEERPTANAPWEVVYSFPPIQAVGTYRSRRLPVNGNARRYVQVISGVGSPFFTRTITRNQFNEPANKLALPFGLNHVGFFSPGEESSFQNEKTHPVRIRRRVRYTAPIRILATQFSSTVYKYSQFLSTQEASEALVEVVGVGMDLTGGTGLKILINGQSHVFLPTQVTYPLPTKSDFSANPVLIANPASGGNVFFGAFYLPLFTDAIQIGVANQTGQYTAGTIVITIKLKG